MDETTSPPQYPWQVFPAEIYNRIIQYLLLIDHDRQDVISLLQLNKAFRHLINERVKPRLVVCHDSNPPEGLVVVGRGNRYFPDSSYDGWLPSMVEYLDLYVHGMCTHTQEQLGLPNVKFRIIRLFEAAAPVSPICQDKDIISCTPLKIVCQQTLVIRGPSPYWRYRVQEGIDTTTVKNVIFMLGSSFLPRITHSDPIIQWYPGLFPAADNITFLIPCVNWSPGPPYTQLHHFQWLARQAERLFGAILNIVDKYQGVKVTLVNFGSIDYGISLPFDDVPESTKIAQDMIQRRFWDQVKTRALRNTGRFMTLAEFSQRVQFRTMEEWIAEGSAEGVLEWHEMTPWL